MRATQIFVRTFATAALVAAGTACLEIDPEPGIELPGDTARVRVVAAASVPALDVWIEEERVVSGLGPGEVFPVPTTRQTVAAGTRVVSFVPDGAPLEDALLTRMFRFTKNVRYTMFTWGTLGLVRGAPLGATLLGNNRPCAEGTSCWRMVHTAAGIGDLDVFVYAKAGEGWQRITDDPLVEGDAMQMPSEVDASTTCYLGVGPVGALVPRVAFKYVAPEGDMLLFLRADAAPLAWLPELATASDDAPWAAPPIGLAGEAPSPVGELRSLDALPRAHPTLLLVGDGWATELTPMALQARAGPQITP